MAYMCVRWEVAIVSMLSFAAVASLMSSIVVRGAIDRLRSVPVMEAIIIGLAATLLSPAHLS